MNCFVFRFSRMTGKMDDLRQRQRTITKYKDAYWLHKIVIHCTVCVRISIAGSHCSADQDRCSLTLCCYPVHPQLGSCGSHTGCFSKIWFKRRSHASLDLVWCPLAGPCLTGRCLSGPVCLHPVCLSVCLSVGRSACASVCRCRHRHHVPLNAFKGSI